MDIADKLEYRRYREASAAWDSKHAFVVNLALPMLLFGSVGAITWAIRGTGGWGGIDGTIVPGMAWGLLWYYLCYRKGIDSRAVVFWLGLGIAIGGELGYGQYVSWIMGRFTVGKEIEVMGETTTYLELARWQGYMWFVIAGASWAAPGGIFLGWALKGKTCAKRWCIRILLPLAFAGIGWLLVRRFPSLFFPHYSPEFYTQEECPDSARTIYTNTQNFMVLMWWIGALLVAKLQKDRPTMVIASLLSVGFGIAFALSATWCLGYEHEVTRGYIDWWKMWELQAGFFLGCLYVLALYWATREVDKVHNPDGTPIVSPETAIKPGIRQEKYRGISLILTVASLLYILFRGGSCLIGGLLGFYDPSKIDQYSWPVARTAIFAPIAILIVGVAFTKMRRHVRLAQTQDSQTFQVPNLHERMTSLIVVITVVGVATIWPSKIGVLYAALLWVAVFAMNRLGYHYDRIRSVTED